MNADRKKRLIELLKEGEVETKEFEELYAEYKKGQQPLKEHLENDEIIRRENKDGEEETERTRKRN